MTLAKDVPIGSIISYTSDLIDRAICIGMNISHNLVVGWQKGQNKCAGWDPVYGAPDMVPLFKKHKCDLGWCISENTDVIIISQKNDISNALKIQGPDGMHCKLCHTFCDMAVPNRSDGQSFICFSCRQNWLPAGM